MGEFVNIVLFGVIFAFLLFTFTANNASVSTSGGAWSQYLSNSLLSASSLTAALLAASIFAIAASIVFPNPYTVFAAVLGLLIDIAKVIPDIFAQYRATYGLDSNVLTFIQVILGLILVFSLLDWYRGQRQL